jgi:hypothetical protein
MVLFSGDRFGLYWLRGTVGALAKYRSGGGAAGLRGAGPSAPAVSGVEKGGGLDVPNRFEGEAEVGCGVVGEAQKFLLGASGV